MIGPLAARCRASLIYWHSKNVTNDVGYLATVIPAMENMIGNTSSAARRTRVVGAFPDGQSALNLAAARLRHIAGTAWSTKRYLNIELLKDQQMRGAITA
jgi:hypothetical protein